MMKIIPLVFVVFCPTTLGFGLAPWSSQFADVSRRTFVQTIPSLVVGSSLLTTSPAKSKAAAGAVEVGGKVVYGDESIMIPKEHGTTSQPVQKDLAYQVDPRLADRICCYNRHFAEFSGYFRTTDWEQVVRAAAPNPVTFYDSVTGRPLFVAPIGRSVDELVQESTVHGWPSFRDQEVVWDFVRVLRNSGETVSVDGTHLGHNLPDRKGNRYCINLVSIAGHPTSGSS